MIKKIVIEWEAGSVEGNVVIGNGKIKKLDIVRGQGKISGKKFLFSSNNSCRMEVSLDKVKLSPGPEPTIVTVHTAKNSFSFFLRDVNQKYPIFIPEYGVIVTDAGDKRTYKQIERGIRSRRLKTKLEHIESEPEENYENAAANTRNLHCPTWLGLSRDMRIFEIDFPEINETLPYIQPRYHGRFVRFPEDNSKGIRYTFSLTRGISCVKNIKRRLEEGILPILHGTLIDEDISYNFTTFVSREVKKFTSNSLKGTHFLVAEGHSVSHMFTREQEQEFKSLLSEEIEMDSNEETVLFFRCEVVNRAAVPRYAWFKTPSPNIDKNVAFDERNGFGLFSADKVFCISKLNGKPLPNEEMSILLGPGQMASFEFFLPHSPISRKRALLLAKQNFRTRHTECRNFWREKLKSAADVRLPEKRVDEMVKAGLLHLDLILYGTEPEGALAPTIGRYCPIASESAPIIQFIDSMGWDNVAKRALMHFLEKQHKDGLIRNCEYMLETGCVLWSIGEHYRYTQDKEWIKEIMPKLLKSCEYILKWRKRNQREDLKGKGYGMLDGKVADPEDPYHQYMLNGYAYLGLIRTAEVIAELDPVKSKRLQQEAQKLRKDILTAFYESVASSPVVPLGDGTWCPTAPSWAEAQHGPLCLYAKKGNWWTHGSFLLRDFGPLYLIFQEVIEPTGQFANLLVKYSSELMYVRNVGLSQPYYQRHPFIHLRRDEVKPFLKSYYNGFAGLADRETYTFWEHYYHVSPHKTHEEAWFLMQTRWMLYMEEGRTLKLLRGIPRSWLENGKSIQLNKVASYFGPLSLKVKSQLDSGMIEAKITCNADRHPKSVEIRLPHPQGKKAKSVRGGRYIAREESVRIEPFEGYAKVVLCF